MCRLMGDTANERNGENWWGEAPERHNRFRWNFACYTPAFGWVARCRTAVPTIATARDTLGCGIVFGAPLLRGNLGHVPSRERLGGVHPNRSMVMPYPSLRTALLAVRGASPHQTCRRVAPSPFRQYAHSHHFPSSAFPGSSTRSVVSTISSAGHPSLISP